MYFGTIRGSGITKRRWATDGQVWLCPHYDKWVTSSGQTENNRAKCIIHGKRPSPLTVSICQPCLCRCCLTALKNPARSWKAGEERARGSQCSLFTSYNSALLLTSGQGVSGWGGGGCRLGKNPFAIWEEQTALLSSKVMRHSSSGEANVLYNSTDCVQIQALLFLLWWEDVMD